jgi:hypothetical protein
MKPWPRRSAITDGEHRLDRLEAAFSLLTVWNAPENAELRQRRSDLNTPHAAGDGESSCRTSSRPVIAGAIESRHNCVRNDPLAGQKELRVTFSVWQENQLHSRQLIVQGRQWAPGG